MSDKDTTAVVHSNKPTAANNVAEREAQLVAITARAERLRARAGTETHDEWPVPLPLPGVQLARTGDVIMEPGEAQARASIAAALIIRGAVQVPSIPGVGQLPDEAGVRLRELTDYVYRLVTMGVPEP